MSLPKVDDWPMWLQVLVVGPHAILAGVLLRIAAVWDFGCLSDFLLGYAVFRFWL